MKIVYEETIYEKITAALLFAYKSKRSVKHIELDWCEYTQLSKQMVDRFPSLELTHIVIDRIKIISNSNNYISGKIFYSVPDNQPILTGFNVMVVEFKVVK